jgi:hypothetical protein
MEFLDAIHEQLVQRTKLSVVLANLENFTGDEAHLASDISAWIRRRVQMSARSAKVDFADATRENAEESDGYFGYLPSVGLQFWSIDEEKELATSITALEWAIPARVVSDAKVGKQWQPPWSNG